MTVRCRFLAVVAVCAVLIGAGCTGGSEGPQIAELDEPLYIQGVQLKKLGREEEALNAFRKVIDKRGLNQAPESHVEAGAIYLKHSKEPLLAYYHFRKYLELQPNSKEAPLVADMIHAAVREFAARLPGRPLDDQSLRLAADEELTKLRREVEELRTENQHLRNVAVGLGNRVQSPVLSSTLLPEAPREPVSVPQPVVTPPSRPFITAPTAQPTQVAPVSTPTRPAGRVHTVRQRESLWQIGREYYGSGVTAAQVNAIFEANRAMMRDATDLRPGMTLRIP